MATTTFNENAMSVREFFNSYEVENPRYLLKQINPAEGESFMALGLTTGDTLDDGRPEYAWFALSRKLVEQGVQLDNVFLRQYADEMQIIEAEDLVMEDGNHPKFGVIFLASSAKAWGDF